MTKKWRRRLLSVFIGLLLMTGGGFYWATGMFHPKARQAETIIKRQNVVKLFPKDRTLSVLSWNVQFMAGGGDNHFFFDRGQDAFPTTLAHYLEVIKLVAGVINQHQPDVILLQEVDRDSARSLNIDELDELLKYLSDDYPYYTCTTYFKANFIPSFDIPGKMDMQLCTISKYKIITSTRIAMPSKLNVDFITQLFYPKRAILLTELQLSDVDHLTVLNTHFSAYSQGTNTLQQQADIAFQELKNAESKGGALIGGDFNSLASHKLICYVHNDEKYMHSKVNSPISKLLDNFKSFPNQELLSSAERNKYLTYIPSCDARNIPTTAIDYIFISKQLDYIKTEVLQEGNRYISDHYPLLVKIKLN